MGRQRRDGRAGQIFAGVGMSDAGAGVAPHFPAWRCGLPVAGQPRVEKEGLVRIPSAER